MPRESLYGELPCQLEKDIALTPTHTVLSPEGTGWKKKKQQQKILVKVTAQDTLESQDLIMKIPELFPLTRITLYTSNPGRVTWVTAAEQN